MGPIGAASSCPPPGLVAAVLPTPVMSGQVSLSTQVSTTPSTATRASLTQILARENKKHQVAEPFIVNRVGVPPALRENVFKSNLDTKHSKAPSKSENPVKELQMQNVGVESSSCLGGGGDSKPGGGNSGRLPQSNADTSRKMSESPVVTVTIRSKGSDKDQLVIKRPKDWKEVVKAQSIVSLPQSVLPKTKSSLSTPLRVPRPNFQFFDKSSRAVARIGRAEQEDTAPTFHIPQKSDKPAFPETVAGHPGLPCGLQRITSSLIHNAKSSPTKMALKEMKKIQPVVSSKPLAALAPLACSPASPPDASDTPPQLSPQCSLPDSEPASRSRLQLKPATSPKLSIEQYLTVSDHTAGLVEKISPALGETSDPATPSKVEKKPKREARKSLQQKPVLIPWSKRSKEQPKRSGGWTWKGEGFVAKVYLNVSDN